MCHNYNKLNYYGGYPRLSAVIAACSLSSDYQGKQLHKITTAIVKLSWQALSFPRIYRLADDDGKIEFTASVIKGNSKKIRAGRVMSSLINYISSGNLFIELQLIWRLGNEQPSDGIASHLIRLIKMQLISLSDEKYFHNSTSLHRNILIEIQRIAYIKGD